MDLRCVADRELGIRSRADTIDGSEDVHAITAFPWFHAIADRFDDTRAV
jgi:hypothetical protein